MKPPTGACSPGVRGIFVANLVAQTAILVTGAVVRLTGSGLGCPTWPQCVEGSYAPTARQAEAWHKYVEFGNRLLTFVLVALAIAAVVAAVAARKMPQRQPLRCWMALPAVAPPVLASTSTLPTPRAPSPLVRPPRNTDSEPGRDLPERRKFRYRLEDVAC